MIYYLASLLMNFPSVDVPPHLNSNYQPTYSRTTAVGDSRYSKDQLLDLFRAQGESGNSKQNLSDLFVDGWNPGAAQNLSNGTWGRRDDNKESGSGPEICWDYDGSTQPIGLTEFSEEELEVSRLFNLVTTYKSPNCE